MNPFLHVAAAAGAGAANMAINRATNWLQGSSSAPQPLNTMGQMQAALPNTQPYRARRKRGGTPGRGRGRGRASKRGQARAAGQPNNGITTRSGEVVMVQGSEVLTVMGVKTLQVFQFNPSAPSLVRLAAQEKMYARFRIVYFNITYKASSATNVAGRVTFGLHPGPKNDQVLKEEDVMKLRPFVMTPVWKSESIAVGKNIDSQKFMFCGDTTADGVAFTLYAITTADSPGIIMVSYRVEFAYPHPF